MSYQFGTNWSVFADKAGPVSGRLMGYEVLTAFFLEAGFLGVMLFGLNARRTRIAFRRHRHGRRRHLHLGLLDPLGQQLDADAGGYAVNAVGQFMPVDWWAIIFNPSFPYRLVHMVLAAYLTTAFVVGAVGAWHLLRDRDEPPARAMFSMAMWMAALVAPIQISPATARPQHARASAGKDRRHGRAFRDPAPARRSSCSAGPTWRPRRPLEMEIPKLGSLILTHNWNGVVQGLKDWPKEDWPNATIIFWSFRVMVGLGFLMLGLGLSALWGRWRGRLYDTRWLHRSPPC